MRLKKEPCQFCKTKIFEKWRSKKGEGTLEGIRCKNKCLGSYIINQEFLLRIPKENEER